MRVFLFLIAFVSTIFSHAQDEFIVALEDDAVIISYQVLEVKKKGAMLPELRISVTNKSDSYIVVGSIINLHYDMEFIEATQFAAICVAPGKTKKGKIKGLFYQPEGLNYAQMKSDDFEIILDEVVINEVENCK